MMKVQELSGAMLDYWVAKADPMCEGCKLAYVEDHAAGPHYIGTCEDGVAFFIPTNGIAQVLRLEREYQADRYRPHVDWSQGGVLIDGMQRIRIQQNADGYAVQVFNDPGCLIPTYGYGKTILIAAMRCFVASKFGEEAPDLPEE